MQVSQSETLEDEMMMSGTTISRSTSSIAGARAKIVMGRARGGRKDKPPDGNVFKSSASGPVGGPPKPAVPSVLQQGTASPYRGQQRFLTVNLQASGAGREAVEQQSAAVMRHVAQFRAESPDPRLRRERAQAQESNYFRGGDMEASTSRSPCKKPNILNFSPSPIPSRPEHVRRIRVEEVEDEVRSDADLNTTNRRPEDARNENSKSNANENPSRKEVSKFPETILPEISPPNLEKQDSDGFLQTPVNVRLASKPAVLPPEVAETPDICRRPKEKTPFNPALTRESDLGLGFDKPAPAKAKKACEQLPPVQAAAQDDIFKAPAVPVPKVTSKKAAKRKADEVFPNSAEIEPTRKYLKTWVPRLREKKSKNQIKEHELYVEGTLIDLDKTPPELGQERRYISSAIVKRMDQNTVSSKKGTLYVLEGGLAIQDLENERVQVNQLPHFILDRFSQGFPENWEKLKRHWVQFIESNKTNIENMTAYNSMLFVNSMTMNATGSSTMSVLSGLSNQSRFITPLPVVGPPSAMQNRSNRMDGAPQLRRAGSSLPKLCEETEQEGGREEAEEINAEAGEEEEEGEDRIGKAIAGKATESRMWTKQCQVQIPRLPVTDNWARKANLSEGIRSRSPKKIQEKKKGLQEKKSGPEVQRRGQKKDKYDANDDDPKKTVKNGRSRSRNSGGVAEISSELQRKSPRNKQARADSNSVRSRAEGRETLEEINTVLENNNTPPPSEEAPEQTRKGTAVKKSSQNKDNKKIKRKLGCELCGVSFTNEERLDKHFKTKTHIKNVEKQGKTHNVEKKSETHTEPPAVSYSPELLAKSVPGLLNFVCFACNTSLASENEMMQHVKLATHSRKLKQCDSSEPLVCNYCNWSTNDRDALFGHFSDSKTHRKNVSKNKALKLGKIRDQENHNFEENESNGKKEPRKTKPRKRKSSSEHDEEVISGKNVKKSDENKSRFGRNLKRSALVSRKSCIYNTPPQEESEDELQPEPARKADVSLRRTVLDPFKKMKETLPQPKVATKNTEEILSKVTVKPSTVKQRMQNAEALNEYNENHEDDLFGTGLPKAKVKKPLLKTSRNTLLSQDTDSESEADISRHSARTPIQAYKSKSVATPDSDKIPDAEDVNDTSLTPAIPKNNGRYGDAAFIQKKLADKKKGDKKLTKKSKLKNLVTQTVSRTKLDLGVDQSRQVIANTITNFTTASQEANDSTADSYFDEEEEN